MEPHIIKIDTWEMIRGILNVWIQLWWLWLLALAIGLLRPFINYLFKKLKKKN